MEKIGSIIGYGLGGLVILLSAIVLIVLIWDRFFQKKNLIKANYPLLGRFRYIFHDLRPLFRQYFGDDDSFAPRIIIDWILDVAKGKTGYFSFDKFDTTEHLHDGHHQMIHAASPLNMDEMKPEYPLIGKKRKHPFQMKSYFYRSAMSLGSIAFEATQAMCAAAADCNAAFNTGEGALSVHHIPRVKYSKAKKFFKAKKVPKFFKLFYILTPGKRLKNHFIDFLGSLFCEKGLRDIYLFDEKAFVFYTIDWEAPLSAFPKPEDLDESFGNIILQVGSGLYGLRKKRRDDKIEFDPDRFAKMSSFARAIEIKLAQGAKQTGGILKAIKNTPVIAHIRGVHPGIDLVSPNRFPFYPVGDEDTFFDFIEELSKLSGGKPVGCKIAVSDESNVERLAKKIAENPKKGPDFITTDSGDGGSATAPIHLGILFGKTIFESINIANEVLKKHKVRDKITLFASGKLYAPHASARALALGADAIGLARSIMVAGGCIRAGLCSGERGDCPVGMATLKKSKRRAYAQALDQKIKEISNYINAHDHGLEQVAAITGVKSPSKLSKRHLAHPDRLHH